MAHIFVYMLAYENPKDKFNKSTRRICLIYFSLPPFIYNFKFPLWNLNINNLMLINFHISLITKRFLRSFHRHSDKTVTLSELLQDINNFSRTIVDVIRKSHEFSFEIVRVIAIVVSNPVNFLMNARLWRQSIATWYSIMSRFSAILLLSPPSYILYALMTTSLYLSSMLCFNYIYFPSVVMIPATPTYLNNMHQFFPIHLIFIFRWWSTACFVRNVQDV